MIETGIELVDAIINNPMQTVIILGGTFVVYKYWFTGDNCHTYNKHKLRKLERDIREWTNLLQDVVIDKFINYRDRSFCGLNVDMMEKVHSMIKMRKAFNWDQRSRIMEETKLSHAELHQIIRALINQGKIKLDDEHRMVITA